jgi:hypothetical protein
LVLFAFSMGRYTARGAAPSTLKDASSPAVDRDNRLSAQLANIEQHLDAQQRSAESKVSCDPSPRADKQGSSPAASAMAERRADDSEVISEASIKTFDQSRSMVEKARQRGSWSREDARVLAGNLALVTSSQRESIVSELVVGINRGQIHLDPGLSRPF